MASITFFFEILNVGIFLLVCFYFFRKNMPSLKASIQEKKDETKHLQDAKSIVEDAYIKKLHESYMQKHRQEILLAKIEQWALIKRQEQEKQKKEVLQRNQAFGYMQEVQAYARAVNQAKKIILPEAFSHVKQKLARNYTEKNSTEYVHEIIKHLAGKS